MTTHLVPELIPIFGIDDHELCTCRRAACNKPGKHPIPHHWKGAGSDDPRRWEWWRHSKHPGCNLALLTGPVSGVLALDIDTPDAVIVAEALGLPRGPRVGTARGIHALLRYPDDRHVGNPFLALDGMQFKGHNGYTLYPPSRHVSGSTYEFIEGYGPDLPLPEVPAWAWDALAGTGSERPPRLRHAVGEGRLVLQGRRYLTLTSLAGWLRYLGVGVDHTLAALEHVNETLCRPPLEDEDFAAIQPERFESPEPDGGHIRALATVLEQYQPGDDALGHTEFAVLVDGHLHMAARQGSPQYVTTERLLAMHSKMPRSTASDATRRLVDKGILERTTKGITINGRTINSITGTFYRLDVDRIVSMLPTTWDTSGSSPPLPGVPLLGGVIPLPYLLPLTPLYLPSSLYGRVVRLTTQLERVDRRLLKALTDEPQSTADLIERTGIPRSSFHRVLRQMREHGLVETPRRGHHRLVDDLVEAVESAREQSGEAEATRRREAAAAVEVRAFAEARERWVGDAPFSIPGPVRGRVSL